MKLAYLNYLKAKDMISIPSIAMRNQDPNELLSSNQFTTLERIVTSEELPITMFLTNIAKEIKCHLIFQNSKLIRDEILNLFCVQASQNSISWLFGAHIQSMIKQGTFIPNYKAILEYCLELDDSVNVDAFFKNEIAYHVKFDKNLVFKTREKMSLEELKTALERRGY
jgi:hypothetical protein